jgi:hypothetical protein
MSGFTTENVAVIITNVRSVISDLHHRENRRLDEEDLRESSLSKCHNANRAGRIKITE